MKIHILDNTQFESFKDPDNHHHHFISNIGNFNLLLLTSLSTLNSRVISIIYRFCNWVIPNSSKFKFKFSDNLVCSVSDENISLVNFALA